MIAYYLVLLINFTAQAVTLLMLAYAILSWVAKPWNQIRHVCGQNIRTVACSHPPCSTFGGYGGHQPSRFNSSGTINCESFGQYCLCSLVR